MKNNSTTFCLIRNYIALFYSFLLIYIHDHCKAGLRYGPSFWRNKHT
jgi:hypothetical protein